MNLLLSSCLHFDAFSTVPNISCIEMPYSDYKKYFTKVFFNSKNDQKDHEKLEIRSRRLS